MINKYTNMLDNQFLLRKAIGQGGSSKVFLAEHVETSEKYAIKILRKDKDYDNETGSKMLSKEHERMIILEGHPNILKSYTTNDSGILDIHHEK